MKPEEYNDQFFNWLQSRDELDKYEAALDISEDFTDQGYRLQACDYLYNLEQEYLKQKRIPVVDKYPKVTRENIEKYLLEYQLEIIGKHLVDTLDDDLWYFNFTMTRVQRDEFRKHAIKTIQRVLKCNRGKAYDIFDHFVGNLGLRIKN